MESQDKRTKEYATLQDKFDKLMMSLKGTRDQRIKEIEKKTVSYVDLIKKLQEKEFREKEGRQLALFKKAVKQQEDELSDYHTYVDGELDLPILDSKSAKWKLYHILPLIT